MYLLPVEPLTVTENGVYEAEQGKGFNIVNVEVEFDKSAVIKEIVEARGGRADRLFEASYPKSALTTELAEELISYDTFENAYSMEEAFKYCTIVERYPKMNTKNVENFSMAFYANYLISPLDIDTRNAINLNNAFAACLGFIRIPLYDTRKVQTAAYCLFDCRNLQYIPEWDLRSCTNLNAFLTDNFALEEIWIKNIKANFTFGNRSKSPKVKQECLIHLIKECRDTGSAKTLTLGSELFAKIANVYVRLIAITDEMRAEDDLIDEKLPFEVCEPTDEGAMLITEYALLKNWQIAG